MGEENISENDAEVTQYQVQSLSFFCSIFGTSDRDSIGQEATSQG
jgi:hypothetical protein